MACGLAMSGVEVSKEPKEPQVHVCASCMNTVVQTFNHFQEQIAQLKREKASLQKELKNLAKNMKSRNGLWRKKSGHWKKSWLS
jgi:peptidoglycan hydrolase CwlO-like protein